MDPAFYKEHNPFKKAPKSNTQLKVSVLLMLLGAFAFFIMGTGARAAMNQRSAVSEARSSLMPLRSAPMVANPKPTVANVSIAAKPPLLPSRPHNESRPNVRQQATRGDGQVHT